MELESLDPQDWEKTRQLAHELIDRSIDHTRDVRDRPIWADMPDDIRAFFSSPVPETEQDLTEIMSELFGKVFAYPMGNIHPRFWAGIWEPATLPELWRTSPPPFRVPILAVAIMPQLLLTGRLSAGSAR